MTINEVSHALGSYLIDFFEGCQISNLDECLFVENYIFDFQEIAHLIPKEHHHLFKPTDKFNGTSGFVQFDTAPEAIQKNEYTAILLTNEDYTKALIFGLEERENAASTSKTIVLKNFLA